MMEAKLSGKKAWVAQVYACVYKRSGGMLLHETLNLLLVGPNCQHRSTPNFASIDGMQTKPHPLVHPIKWYIQSCVGSWLCSHQPWQRRCAYFTFTLHLSVYLVYLRLLVTFLNSSDDGGKVVIKENHVCCLLWYIWSCDPHGNSCGVPNMYHWSVKITNSAYKYIHTQKQA